CGKRYVDRVEDVTKVTVYCNLPEVELFVNGKSLGVQKKTGLPFFYFDVPNAGVSTLKAVAGEYTDESTIRKVETFNEAYRLKEKGAILNWFDITAPEGYFSLNDKLSDIMANPQGQAMFGQLLKQMMAPKDGEEGKAKTMGFEIDPAAMMKMMGGFTVLRLTSLMGAANVTMTKEQLLGLNAMLNQIPKA
ncbi:MAG: DUF4982 domain-containing protein, partial [Clostridia bacterium]|nr:DUF4982 domain-containing protein [Clostridia bacterium]